MANMAEGLLWVVGGLGFGAIWPLIEDGAVFLWDLFDERF